MHQAFGIEKFKATETASIPGWDFGGSVAWTSTSSGTLLHCRQVGGWVCSLLDKHLFPRKLQTIEVLTSIRTRSLPGACPACLPTCLPNCLPACLLACLVNCGDFFGERADCLPVCLLRCLVNCGKTNLGSAPTLSSSLCGHLSASDEVLRCVDTNTFWQDFSIWSLCRCDPIFVLHRPLSKIDT